MTDKEKQARLKKGQPLVFDPPPEEGEETPEQKQARTIQAAWLEALAAGHEHAVRVPIQIENAIIDGPLDLSYATFECNVSITNTQWTDTVVFAFAHFKRAAQFDGSRFAEWVGFRAAQADADFDITGCSFSAAASFQDLHVGEVLSAQGATFSKGADFDRIVVAKGVFFRAIVEDGKLRPVRFGGEASFLGAHIGGDADFEGAQFEGRDKAASFDRAKIDGNAFFQPAEDKQGKFLPVVFKGEARFLGAHIGGNAEFNGAQFEGAGDAASFDRAKIDGSAFFQPAEDKQGNLHPVVFKGEARFHGAHIGGVASFIATQFEGTGRAASFDGAKIEGAAFFQPAEDKQGNVHPVVFKGEARFLGARIGGVADFEGAQFEATGNAASFDGARIDGGAFFRPAEDGQGNLHQDKEGNLYPVVFKGHARFHGAHIGGDASFIGAQFEGPGRAASFDGATIDGAAFFRPAEDKQGNVHPVVFKGEARFHGAHIGGNAEFEGAQFEGTNKAASFDGAQIEGNAFFRPAQDKQGKLYQDKEGNLYPVVFKGPARFLGAHIGGNAEFDGAQFEGPDKAASFDGVQIDGPAFFRPDKKGNPVRFAGAASFPAAQFRSEAQFTRAQFEKAADFENASFQGRALFRGAQFHAKAQASFIGARFERGAYFNGAQFEAEADFTAAKADRDADFTAAQFKAPVSFREAHFEVAQFREELSRREPEREPPQFGGRVDLRGFTYERIYVAWEDLLRRMRYDRQPYAQMEKAVRASGDDRTADDIYYTRRRRENRMLWRSVRNRPGPRKTKRDLPAALGNQLWGWLVNYGVRPHGLLYLGLLVLLVGLRIFLYPGAVEPVGGTNSDQAAAHCCTLKQAAGVSLYQFLPVGIPSGSRWKASERPIPASGSLAIPFSAYATIHRMMGWLLVPLGVAALTGWLHRRASA